MSFYLPTSQRTVLSSVGWRTGMASLLVTRSPGMEASACSAINLLCDLCQVTSCFWACFPHLPQHEMGTQ